MVWYCSGTALHMGLVLKLLLHAILRHSCCAQRFVILAAIVWDGSAVS
jgi:hypothetical protein